MKEFWEKKFKKGTIWEFEPANSAISTANYFFKHGIKKVLIPGIGYGRNAMPFLENEMNLTGIEISKSAIQIARENGFTFPIHQASILEMPFNDTKYDGIYCYSMLHLFNKRERTQILKTCYNQLNKKAEMIFVVVSIKADMYGSGKLISKNRFKIKNGLNVFYYDSQSIENEFKNFGLIAYIEIDEPIKFMTNELPLKCFVIKCKK